MAQALDHAPPLVALTSSAAFGRGQSGSYYQEVHHHLRQAERTRGGYVSGGHCLYTAWVAIRSTQFTNDSFVPLCITILRKRRSYHRLGSAIRIVELHYIIDIVYHTKPACIVIYCKKRDSHFLIPNHYPFGKR